jgi:hypothetical protein
LELVLRYEELIIFVEILRLFHFLSIGRVMVSVFSVLMFYLIGFSVMPLVFQIDGFLPTISPRDSSAPTPAIPSA